MRGSTHRETPDLTLLEGYPDQVTNPLNDSGPCLQFPDEALELLSSTIHEPQWVSGGLRNCMIQISSAKPGLQADRDFQRLMDLYRRKKPSDTPRWELPPYFGPVLNDPLTLKLSGTSRLAICLTTAAIP